MKKENILKVLLIVTTLSLLIPPKYLVTYAEDITQQQEETTSQTTTTLDDTLKKDKNIETSSISIGSVLLSFLGMSLFILAIYYMLKNFNIGSGK